MLKSAVCVVAYLIFLDFLWPINKLPFFVEVYLSEDAMFVGEYIFSAIKGRQAGRSEERRGGKEC